MMTNMKKMLAVLSACTLMTGISANISAFAETTLNPVQSIIASADEAENFLGTWGQDRCTITISKETDGNGYQVAVRWSTNAAQSATWTYSHCTFVNGTLGASFSCNGQASHSLLTYAEDGTITDADVQYTNGSGIFRIKDNVLYWEDLMEDVANDMTFLKGETNSSVSAEDCLGKWGSGKCTIEISRETDENGYQIAVTWRNTATQVAKWYYNHCTFENGTFTCNKNASYSVLTYTEDDTITSADVKYTDGSGTFTVQDNQLYWNDLIDDVASGVAFAKEADAFEISAEDYLGTWGSGKCTIIISKEQGNNGYHVSVTWRDNAAEASIWTYSHCTFKNGTFFCSEEGSHSVITYAEDDTIANVSLKSTNGSATFTIQENQLYWNDLKDDAAYGMIFVKGADAPVPAPAGDCLGTWGSGKCTIVISEEEDGNGYQAAVTWRDNAEQISTWSYRRCTFDNGTFFCIGEASHSVITYAEDGTANTTVRYTGGSGTFTVENNLLYWNDLIDNVAEGTIFIKGADTAVQYLPGDADGSGKIDILDVITINKAILGKEKLTAEQLKAIDFNSNSKPEASEALMIMKYIVGLITDFS